MTKKLACADMGMTECSFNAESESEEELLKQMAGHAAKEHGMTEMSGEGLEKLKAAIKEE